MADPELKHVLSEKMHKYGILGAAVVTDPLETIRAAQEEQKRKALAADLPTTKAELLSLLREVGLDQAEVQKQSLLMIRRLVKDETPTLSAILEEVRKLALPSPTLERKGIKEAAMHDLLEPYAEDMEVMKAMQECESKSGLGDMQRVKKMKFKELVDIHEYMALKLRKVVEEVEKLSDEAKVDLSPRTIEVAAEVLVGIHVEKRFKVKNEDIELAIELNEEALGGNERFAKVQEELQELMARMMQMIKPAEKLAEERQDFKDKLERVAKIQRSTKEFMESRRTMLTEGEVTYTQAYEQLLELTSKYPGNDVDLIELRLRYDTQYKGRFPEIDKAWEQNRLDFQSFMTSLMFSQGNPNMPQFPPPPVPPSQFSADAIVEMQELMLSSLKRHVENLLEVPDRADWKPDLALALLQGLASADFEAQFGTSAEDMTIASFDKMQELQGNQRFIQASMEQQQILQSIPEILNKADGKCCVQ